MIRTTLIFASLLIFSVAFQATAQDQVCGQISAFNKYPLKGVDVEAKKSKRSTKTDEEGKFCLPVNKNDKLTVKAEGFETSNRRVSADDKADVNLVYKSDQKSFARVVGLGYMDANDLNYAVDHLADENNNFSEYTNIFTLITSRFPGVTVGTDNNGNGTIIIRSVRSILNDPGALYVVNGLIVPAIAQINPADVATIDIVKDSGATIYGMKGANGAVVITTKSK